MTRNQNNRVTFGPREWLGVAGIGVTILLTVLGTSWKLSVDSEARFTRLEMRVDVLSAEVNRLRDRPPCK